ncbi:Inosine-uridine preferring nucleoside hydrolase, partial [Teladorsagia circumcincta]
TDGVSDDMRAISLAIQHPNVELIAITTVHGCVKVEQATANVARAQRANSVEKSIPIYMGASEALLRRPFVLNPFFGIDGIGDRPDLFPEVSSKDFTVHESESAALALIRLTAEHDDVTLVCIGPLTNVALAHKLDRNFAKRLRKLVILGGNYFGKRKNEGRARVPRHGYYSFVYVHEKLVDFEAHLKMNTPLASFLAMATHIGNGVMAKSGRQYGYCDEIAVAVAIDEKVVATKTMDLRLGVEVAGQMTSFDLVWKRAWECGTLDE